MSKRLIKDSTLGAIADSIRTMGGADGSMTPAEMPGKILNIPVNTGGGGVELPALSNPAGSGQILSGYQAISGSGVAITGSHVCPTAADLTKDADAVADDVAEGKIVYVKGQRIEGTHVCDPGLDTSDATATPEQVAEGATYYSQGEKKTGSAHVVSTALNEFGELSATDDRITLASSFSDPTLFPAGTKHNVRAYLSNFGDATAADVANGKTFTSAAGLNVVGTFAGSAKLDLVTKMEARASKQTYELDPNKTYVIFSAYPAASASATKIMGLRYDRGAVTTDFSYGYGNMFGGTAISGNTLTTGSGHTDLACTVLVYEAVV